MPQTFKTCKWNGIVMVPLVSENIKIQFCGKEVVVVSVHAWVPVLVVPICVVVVCVHCLSCWVPYEAHLAQCA